MRALDLTDNMTLLCGASGLLLADRRARRDGNVERFNAPGESLPAARDLPVVAALDALRIGGGADTATVASVAWEDPNEIYAGKVLEGVARFTDGATEHWRIRIEPIIMRFHWTRQPDRAGARAVFRIVTPGRDDALQFWHTGGGATLANAAVPGAAEAAAEALDAAEECEVLYYSTSARNCLRVELPSGGALALRRGVPAPFADGGQAAAWECAWTAHAAAVVQLSVTCGIANAARHFDGRQRMQPANATYDFDHFHARASLGALSLNLVRLGRGHLAARAEALGPAGDADRIAGLREAAWSAEFLYLLDPVVAAALARDTLQRVIEDSGPVAGLWPEHRIPDEGAALLLLLAGRYHRVSGDAAFLAHHVEALRRCALHVLGSRSAGRAVPSVHPPWEAPDAPRAQEPAYTAVACAGLERLAGLETALGYDDHAEWWRAAARAARAAACAPVEDGGLWDAGRGVFIRGRACPGAGGEPDGHERDFLLYQNVIPFWLGLVEDSGLIRRAYDWIDDRYTYASGRGERTLPPGAARMFVTLLDVCVRHRHGAANAVPLLCFLMGRAMDGGLPFPRAPFGSYARGGPLSVAGDFAHTRTGSLMDGAPYFGLTLGLHYGLEYDHRGWHIGTPNPLPGYPITRVSHLRHRHARYAVTWQPRGRPGRILLDGKPHHGPLLDLTEGDHEVVAPMR